MIRRSLNVVAPRWRHFIPKGESLNIGIPAYETVRDAAGNVISIQKFNLSVDVVEDYQAAKKQFVFPLPSNVTVNNLNSISVSYNGVVQSNADEVLYYTMDGLTSVPHSGPRLFTFNANTHSIEFQFVDDGRVNRAPPKGTHVEFEIVNDVGTDNSYVRIPIKREFLIQGANPIDSSIVDPKGTGTNSFQGGYRCTLKLISQAAHGHVRISDDKIAFEYRPDMGYSGVDSFAYRLQNALGQESKAFCIRLDVGTNKLPTGA